MWLRKAFYPFYIIAIVMAAQTVYFCWAVNMGKDSRSTDVILVFMGTKNRLQAAYDLARQGTADFMILSPADQKGRERLDRKYRRPESVKHVPETRAATTFQNALFTSRIVVSRHFKTVTLVTSDYHMPRSLALLKLMLAGQGVTVRPYAVGAKDESQGSVPTRKILLKMLYNEAMEFWGSLYEYALWRMTGKLSEKGGKHGELNGFLRSALLLDIQPKW